MAMFSRKKALPTYAATYELILNSRKLLSLWKSINLSIILQDPTWHLMKDNNIISCTIAVAINTSF